MQKEAETTAGLIGNKIADQITSVNKGKPKGKTSSVEINIFSEKYQQIIYELKLL